MRKEINSQNHNSLKAGYWGIKGTMDRIQRKYWFPGIREVIQKYIQGCNLYQKSKTDRYKSYRKIIVPKTLIRTWKSIAINWITKFPFSKEPMTGVVYNLILVITDQLTKYIYFLPYIKVLGAEELTY